MQRTGDILANPTCAQWCRWFDGRGTMATTLKTIGDLGDTGYTEMTAAGDLTISCANAADTSAGTGMRTVRVVGLDANWNVVYDDVALNGQTAVALTKVKLHPYVIIGTSTGSGGTNAGIIYVGSGTVNTGVPAVINNAIGVTGINQSRMAFMPVPAGYQCVIDEIAATTAGTVAGNVFAYFKPFGGIWLGADGFDLPAVAGYQKKEVLTPALAPKTLIKFMGKSASSTLLLGCQAKLKFYKQGV